MGAEVNLSILQATAIGDALGAGYEYIPQAKVKSFVIDWGYERHPLHTEIEPGMWTDDTMRSVAAARALLIDLDNGTRLRGLGSTFADEMVSLHKAHPTKGYSKGMLAALNQSEDGLQFYSSYDQHGRTESNGSAMCAAVYGVLHTLDHVELSVDHCSAVTHKGLGIEGAFIVAAASWFFVHRQGSKADLLPFINGVNSLYTTRMRERVAKQNGPLTFLTVTAALTAIRESETLTEVVEKSIRVGGDVDSVAAIAMGIASSCPDIRDDLPPFVRDQIKPVAGLTWDVLVDLDKSLSAVVRL